MSNKEQEYCIHYRLKNKKGHQIDWGFSHVYAHSKSEASKFVILQYSRSDIFVEIVSVDEY